MSCNFAIVSIVVCHLSCIYTSRASISILALVDQYNCTCSICHRSSAKQLGSQNLALSRLRHRWALQGRGRRVSPRIRVLATMFQGWAGRNSAGRTGSRWVMSAPSTSLKPPCGMSSSIPGSDDWALLLACTGHWVAHLYVPIMGCTSWSVTGHTLWKFLAWTLQFPCIISFEMICLIA